MTVFFDILTTTCVWNLRFSYFKIDGAATYLGNSRLDGPSLSRVRSIALYTFPGESYGEITTLYRRRIHIMTGTYRVLYRDVTHSVGRRSRHGISICVYILRCPSHAKFNQFANFSRFSRRFGKNVFRVWSLVFGFQDFRMNARSARWTFRELFRLFRRKRPFGIGENTFSKRRTKICLILNSVVHEISIAECRLRK